MTENLEKLKSKLSEKNIKFDVTSDGIKILEEGNYEINIYDDGDEFTIFLDEAHCHFETIDEVIEILDYALSGKLKIIYKLRGNMVVANKIQIIENGIPNLVTWSGLFLSPFWRKKSFQEKFFRKPQ